MLVSPLFSPQVWPLYFPLFRPCSSSRWNGQWGSCPSPLLRMMMVAGHRAWLPCTTSLPRKTPTSPSNRYYHDYNLFGLWLVLQVAPKRSKGVCISDDVDYTSTGGGIHHTAQTGSAVVACPGQTWVHKKYRYTLSCDLELLNVWYIGITYFYTNKVPINVCELHKLLIFKDF